MLDPCSATVHNGRDEHSVRAKGTIVDLAVTPTVKKREFKDRPNKRRFGPYTDSSKRLPNKD